jgi:hypothetical protein
MRRLLTNVSYPSGQPNNPNTGGGYYNTSAFLQGPFLERVEADVIDNRVTFGSPNLSVGSLVIVQRNATNFGAANYLPSQIANESVPYLGYGIISGVPTPLQPGGSAAPGGEQLAIVQDGYVNALCVTGATAIAPGTLLTADGAGNLTAFNPPAAAPTPTATPFGTTGAANVSYKLAAVSFDGVVSALGSAGSASTANATISGTNGVLVAWTPVADAAYYIIVRTVGGAAQGVIGTAPGNSTSFVDAGQGVVPNTSATVFVPTLTAPSAPTVVQVSGATAGTTSYTYKITAVGPNGVYSAESTGTALSTSAAILSPTQGNKITWTAVTGAQYYVIDRSASAGTPSSTGTIGYANAATAVSGFVDYGQAAIAYATVSAPVPVPRPGVCLGVALGTLAASISTPTLVAVDLGF